MMKKFRNMHNFFIYNFIIKNLDMKEKIILNAPVAFLEFSILHFSLKHEK